MSSKGQVVIPEEIRESSGLDVGTQFVVLGNGDAVVLKVITPPKTSEFKKLLNEAKRAAKKEGLTKVILENSVRKSRSK